MEQREAIFQVAAQPSLWTRAFHPKSGLESCQSWEKIISTSCSRDITQRKVIKSFDPRGIRRSKAIKGKFYTACCVVVVRIVVLIYNGY